MDDGDRAVPRSESSSGDTDIRTFLIADVRGYTLFTQERGDEAAGKLAAKFAELAREAVEARGGTLLELRGDEALCVFGSPRQAIRTAVDLQERFVEETLAAPELPLTVGIGLDAGEAVAVEGGYRGGALNLAARLCGQARAGEILASREVAHLARRVEGVRYEQRGTLSLKGLAEPVHVVRVVPEDMDAVARLQPYAPVRPQKPAPGRRRPWPVAIAATIAVALIAIAIPLLRPDTSVEVRSNSIARLSADGGRVDLATPLGDRLGASAFGFGSVWVAQPDRARVVRVDPADGEIQDSIEVGASPSGIAIGAGSVWVTNAGDGTVSRISPETNSAGEPLPAGSRPTGIALGGGAVWVADSLTGRLLRIDAATGATDERDLPGLPSGVAFTDDGVWVTMAPADVARVDPDDLEIELTRGVGSGPSAVLSAFGSVWVANELDGTVSRIEPSTGSERSKVAVGDGPSALAAAAGKVWVTTRYDGLVTPIEPASTTVGERVRIGASLASVSASGDDLWLAAAASLTEHRGGTLTVASQEPIPDTLDFSWQDELPGTVDPSEATPPKSLDPAYIYGALGWQILSVTNDGLLGFEKVGGPDGTTLVPDLAAAFPEISPDGLTYRFQLRDGIKYSTGEPVQPEDFRHAIERAIAYDRLGPGAIHFGAIKGAAGCDLESCDLSNGIETGDGSVTFHLSRQDGDLPLRLSLPFAYPVPASVPFEDQGLEPVPATGPYRIESVQGDAIELVRNDHFVQWSGAAQPDGFADGVVWTTGLAQGPALSRIADDRLHWFNDPAASDELAQLDAAHPDQVIDSPQAFTMFVGFDVRFAPFNDVRVRQAVNFAIDRERVMGFLGGPTRHRPTCQIIPPNFQGYVRFCPYTLAPERDVWSAPDVQRARALVRAAGAVDERVRVWITDDSGGFPAGVRAVETMTYVTDVLNEIGLRPELTVVPIDRYFGTLYGGQPPGAGGPPHTYLSGWISDYPGGGDFIETQFTCDGGVNVSGYCDPRLDELIAEAKQLQATDPAEANRTWTQIEHQLVRDAVWAPLSNPITTYAFSSQVENVQVHPQWGPLLSQIWVE